MTKEKRRVLFLDDRSKRFKAAIKKYKDDDLTIVCTVKECIKMISNEGPWDLISLDHDLNFEEFVDSGRSNCGMEVVRFLEENEITLKTIAGIEDTNFIVHTSNAVAGRQMTVRISLLELDVLHERFTYE